jgi:hypothetical protein
MNGMSTGWLWTSGNITQSWTADFPPMFTLGYIGLSKVGGSGTARAGILSFRHRLASGADETVVLANSGDGAAPTTFSHENVTSVTFETWSSDALGYATAILTFW